MKKIYDKNLINKVKEEYKIDNYFSKEYEFIGIEYEEDETMINPLEKTQYIQFVLEGTLLISFIDQEGRQTGVFWLNYNLFTYLYFFLRLILNIIATTDEIINPATNENIQRLFSLKRRITEISIDIMKSTKKRFKILVSSFL